MSAEGDALKAYYKRLLIAQFRDRTNAAAEVDLRATAWAKILDLHLSFFDEFSLDLAIGEQLDLIGRLVGIARTGAYPVLGTTLNDDDYRFFLRAKIAKNTTHGEMLNDLSTSVQDKVRYIFGNDSHVRDTYNMLLRLDIADDVSIARARALNNADLLPRPSGVSYVISHYDDANFFGFSELTYDDDPSGVGGFGELNENVGGKFAEAIHD